MPIRPNINPNIDISFLNVLSPERRDEIKKYLLIHESDVIEQLQKEDLEVGKLIGELNEEIRNEELINIAGKGYRKLGDQLTRGAEKGKFALIPDKPLELSEENQDVLDLLSMMKEYDFIMSGDRVKHDKSHAFLQNRIYDAVKSKVKPASTRTTGKGGVISDPKRMNHPELKQIDDDELLNATAKFLTSNMATNEIQQQPSGMRDKNGNLSSVPIEHTEEAFNNNPSRGLDVDNRDVGSTLPNSITRSEENEQRKLELLYNAIADKAEYIDQTYGVPYSTIMDEQDWMYKRGQKDWNPNQYSGLN